MRAYILVSTDPGQAGAVQAQLRLMTQIVDRVDLILGNYDLMVIVKTETQKRIRELVLNEIPSIPGVQSTVTMLSLDD